jgi:DNA-binding CsgD family transcriptional regulator
MTILQFPAQPAAKREQLIALAADLGAVILWPDEWQPLTTRETDTLALLGRIPRSTQSIAVELFVGVAWCHALLSGLQRKGYIQRVGKHVGGGWVSIERHERVMKAA